MITGYEYLLVGLAAMAAGVVNALAGGGTLITFPILVAVGLPAVAANVTNTVALCPGYLGGSVAQSNDLNGQRRRLWLAVPAGVLGGLVGGWLLLNTGEKLFRDLVPFLILIASGLLAVQEPLRAWLAKQTGTGKAKKTSGLWSVAIGLAAIYGGYFGAGLGVILLAVLALLLEDTLTRLNALKQTISLGANIAAAILFAFSGHVVWQAALVMAVGSLAGGALGGRLAGKINPATLRWFVVAIGIGVAVIYLVRN